MENKLFYRSFEFDRAAIVEESRTIRCTFSSETGYDRGWGGLEVLDHSPESIRMERLTAGAPLLWNHNHDVQIGVVEKPMIEDRKIVADVRFSKQGRGAEIWNDIQDGIIRNVSIGYILEKLVEQKTEDGETIFRATGWTPYELSIVSCPADVTVGIGRSTGLPENVDVEKLQREIKPEVPVKPETPKKQIIILR